MIADPQPLVLSRVARISVQLFVFLAGAAGAALMFLALAPFRFARALADLFARDGSMDSFTAESQFLLWPWLLAAGAVLIVCAVLLRRSRNQAAVWLAETLQETFGPAMAAGGIPPYSTSGTSPRAWAISAAALLCGIWTIYIALGLRFHETGALAHFDVFFASDPPRFIRDLTLPGAGRRGHIHPLFTLWFNPPATVLARWAGSPFTAALLLNTFAGALCAPLALYFFRRIGMPLRLALACVLFTAFSTASLIFSAVPDSFIFGGLSMILLCLAATLTGRQLLMKAAAGIFALGITVTNIVPAILLLTSSARVRLRARLMKGVALAVVIVTATALMASVQKRLFPSARHFLNPDSYGAEVSRFIVGNEHTGSWPVKTADLMLHMWIYTFFGPVPFMRQHQRYYEAGLDFHRGFECHVCERVLRKPARQLPVRSHPVELTFESPHPPRFTAPGLAGALLWLVLAVLACKEMVLRRTVWDGLLTGIVLAIAFHFALHMVFGDDLFLYTPHWAFLTVAAIVLALRHHWESRWLLPVLCGAVVAEIAANAVLVRSILEIVTRPSS